MALKLRVMPYDPWLENWLGFTGYLVWFWLPASYHRPLVHPPVLSSGYQWFPLPSTTMTGLCESKVIDIRFLVPSFLSSGLCTAGIILQEVVNLRFLRLQPTSHMILGSQASPRECSQAFHSISFHSISFWNGLGAKERGKVWLIDMKGRHGKHNQLTWPPRDLLNLESPAWLPLPSAPKSRLKLSKIWS